jgi:hypothetical protein
MVARVPLHPSVNQSDFEIIARLVVGDIAPAWLTKSLMNRAGSLFLDRHVYQKQPTRAEMRDNLEHILKGDVGIGDFDSSGPVVEFITAFGEASEKSCRRALKSLQTEGGATKPGPRKAIPPTGIAPKTYCALIIAEAWEKFHGIRPRQKSARAGQAAELLWRAARGEANFDGEEPNARWRYHFRLADRAEQRELRMEFRRQLSLAEYFSRQPLQSPD